MNKKLKILALSFVLLAASLIEPKKSYAGETFSPAIDACSDAFNPFSPLPLSEDNKKVAVCRLLECERKAAGGLVSEVDAMLCSMSYRLVLIKVFKDEGTDLIRWWTKDPRPLKRINQLCAGVDIVKDPWHLYARELVKCPARPLL